MINELEKYADIIIPVVEKSRELGVKIYLVGGFVRDIILGVYTNDFDFVVEGDTKELSRELLKIFRGRNYKYIDTFGTSSFEFEKKGEIFRIDFARARKEFYPVPGEHPKVEFVDDVRVDLLRRDFTINAIAMEVDEKLNSSIIDVVGGMKDIEERKIRVLHEMSIADDPTRIIRAFRIALKLDFEIDESVIESLEIAKKIGAFKNVAGNRFFSEIKIAAKEKFFDKIMKKLKEFNVLFSIHPALDVEIPEISSEDPDEKIAQIILSISPEHRYEISKFFGVPKRILKKLENSLL